MFCPSCGSQQSDTHVFCDRCGADLREQPSVSTVIKAEPAKKKRSRAAVGIAVAALALAVCAMAIAFFLLYPGVLGTKGEEPSLIDSGQKQEQEGSGQDPKQEEARRESPQEPEAKPEQEPRSEADSASEQAPRSPLEASAGLDPHDDFWGVWVGASESEAGAQAIAEEASSRGLPAEVLLTTDWANLNREPWYVVGVGRFASEEEAQAGLAAAQQAGYADAYVKYSASYVGE